jgi:hypothetical protein
MLPVLMCVLSSLQGLSQKTDSSLLSRDAWCESLLEDTGFMLRKSGKTKLKAQVSYFDLIAREHINAYYFNGTIFLKSPDTLIMRSIDHKRYDRCKERDEKFSFLSKACLDDPETALYLYNELIRLVITAYLKINNYNETLEEKDGSFSYFKLHCYHLLCERFPGNASFNYMIGRWHYNQAMDFLNAINSNTKEEEKDALLERAAGEIRLSLPWIKKAAALYPGFQGAYNKVKELVGE